MTKTEIIFLLEGILLGMLGIWLLQLYIQDRHKKNETKKLVKKMNEWRQEKCNKIE